MTLKRTYLSECPTCGVLVTTSRAHGSGQCAQCQMQHPASATERDWLKLAREISDARETYRV